MKVTNWRRKLIASLVAGGTLVPGIGYALDIPLGDPSFENYVVTPFAGLILVRVTPMRVLTARIARPAPGSTI